MQAVASQPFTPTLLAPGDLTGFGARVEQPVTRAIVTAWQAATKNPTTGVWSVTLSAPIVVGDYLLVWRTSDPEPPDYEVFIPLIVTASAASAAPADWTPTVEQVSELLRARTNVMGTERGVFDDDTRPTAAQVEGLISAAVGDIISRTGVWIPAAYTDDATRLGALRAAALVESSFFPNEIDTDRSAYRQYTAMYLSGVEALAAAIPRAMRLS